MRTALNQVVIKTSPGSAQPVSAAIDAEEWDEVVGTIGGDDTILAITTDSRSAEKLAQRLREVFCVNDDETRIQPAVFGATGYSGFELVRLLARHPGGEEADAAAAQRRERRLRRP